MTKTQIKKTLESSFGSCFLTQTQIARALGMGRDSVRSLLHGVDYLPSGREKRYLIDDIAEKLAEVRQS